jgi:hypothetical protein
MTWMAIHTRPRLLVSVVVTVVTTGGCVRAGFGTGDSITRDGDATSSSDSITRGGDTIVDASVDVPIVDSVTRNGSCSWSPFSTPVKIPNVNSNTTDWTPHLASDGLTLYFSSYRSGGSGADDLWAASRATASDPFGAPSNLAALNSGSNEADPATSPDGLELYYYSSHIPGIRRATRATPTSAFSSPKLVEGLLPDASGGPFLAADGLSLYYQIRTNKQYDLAVARRPSSGAAFVHQRTLDEVNTPGNDEGWPTVSANQLELYFERASASGDVWIYGATRATINDPFGPPTLVQELAVDKGSGDPDLSPDGRTMILAVLTGSDDWDIYVATRSCLP